MLFSSFKTEKEDLEVYKKHMKNKIFIFLSFLLIGLSYHSNGQIKYNYNTDPEQQIVINYSNPKIYEIGDIKIIGAKYLDPIALKSLSGLKIGDQISIPGESISGAIKKLWKQGIIGDIKILIDKIEEGKVYLSIVLKERPRLSTFKLNGIGRTHTSELNEKINLIRGRIVTDATIKNTQNTILNYFKEKGFLNTKVNIQEAGDTIMANSIRLNIDIEKNKKVKINNISFYGNNIYSEAKLKGKLKKTGERFGITLFKKIFQKSFSLLTPKRFFGVKNGITKNEILSFVTENSNVNFLKSSKFIDKEFINDKDNLIKFYESKGYRDIKIIKDSITYEGDFINIDIYVNPGNRYYFRNINWTGNYIYDKNLLNEILSIKKGDIYDIETLNKKITYNPKGTDVSSLYQDNGYLFSNIQPIEVGVIGDSIDVEMRVYEGAQATIDKVNISGNDRTSDHVIVRELRTIPVQNYNLSR